MNTKHYKIFCIVSGIILTIWGCSPSVSNVSNPVKNMPENFSDSGEVELHQKWWQSFQDSQLNSLVNLALDSNFTLRSTWEKMRAAQAVVSRESSSLFPSLEASATGEVTRSNNEFNEGESVSLGLFSDYEIDLWGRINAQIDAADFRLQATYSDYQAAAISLTASITNAWYGLVEASNHLRLAEEQVETNEKILELLKRRFGTGQIRSVDILRQQQLVEATREQMIAAETNYEVAKHQLSVLLGRQPRAELNYQYYDLPSLPQIPETGVPLDLIKRRPDVQSAYFQLRAADRDLAAAISNQYPRLSITASATTSAENVDNLFDNWVTSVAGNLLAPIFYGGQLSAEVDRTEAVKNQRLYEYGQTVLTAMQEVEDALIREKKQQQRIKSLEKQYELAYNAYEQLRIEFFNGIANYLDVLVALNEEQQLQRDLLTARLNRIEIRVALYRALAGGFETDREMTSDY